MHSSYGRTSVMDEQLLINAVGEYQLLYDPSHPKYKDVDIRNAIWKIIAKDLKTEVEPCKAKWRTLRDGFTRALRHQREARNMNPARSKKPWRYQAEMEFLIPFIYTRESKSGQGEKDPDEETDQDAQTKVSPDTDSSAGSCSIDNDDESTVSVISDSPVTATKLPQQPSDTSRCSASARLKRKFESDDITDYFKCRRLELEALFKGSELTSPKAAHCQCRNLVQDPTEAFFASMGQSVKRLPFHLQAQVKMKVCQVVTDAELECLDSASIR